MSRQESIRKWKVGIGINAQVERKSFLHAKRVSNNNLIIIKLLSTCVSTERGSDNED